MDVGMKGGKILTRKKKKKKPQEYDIKLNCLYWTIFRRKLLRFQSGAKNPKQTNTVLINFLSKFIKSSENT